MVAGERRLRILARLAESDGELTTCRLCEICAGAVAVDGAGIMLMAGDEARGSLCATDDVAGRIEDLQYTFGEGPCLDAYHHEQPVSEADLADPVTPRWPAFTPEALAAGVRAVFGFPLRVGAVRLGALDLYRSRPGPLSDDQYADALVAADVATEALLAFQAQAPPGTVAAELEAKANLRFVVAQASGMISMQLNVTITQALVLLRGLAFAHERPVDDVAADIVNRRLRAEDLPERSA